MSLLEGQDTEEAVDEADQSDLSTEDWKEKYNAWREQRAQDQAEKYGLLDCDQDELFDGHSMNEYLDVVEALGDPDPEEVQGQSYNELCDWLMQVKEDVYELFGEEEISSFRKDGLTTYKQLVQDIEKTIDIYRVRKKAQEEGTFEEDPSGKDPAKVPHSIAFYEQADKLLHVFLDSVERLELPEPLPDMWGFCYEITEDEIALFMYHVSLEPADGDDWYLHDEYFRYCDQSIKILSVPVQLLTVEEYATKYGIAPDTVRQWIQSAQVRSAVKYGDEWRISELAELRDAQDYTSCNYMWKDTLTDLPEKYGFLSHFDSARIYQAKNADSGFFVELDFSSDECDRIDSLYQPGEDEERIKDPNDSEEYIDNPNYFDHFTDEFKKIIAAYPNVEYDENNYTVNDYTIHLTSEERKEFELYLIGNPLIHRVSPSRLFPDPINLIEAFSGNYTGRY